MTFAKTLRRVREHLRDAKIAKDRQEISEQQYRMLVRYAMAKEIRSSLAEKSARYLKKYRR